MSAKRIEIMDIRQIIQFKIKDISNRQIALVTGIHRNSVNAYVRLIKASTFSFEELLAFSDHKLSELFPCTGTVDKARYETLSNQYDYFRQELKKPGCTRLALWKDYLTKNPDGYKYSQFNEHLNRWFKKIKVSGKLEHKAGDKLYVDYTGKKLSYIDRSTGEVIEVEVFVGILPCSGYTYVQASPSQKREDFIDSMNSCLRFFGGVPKAIVPDNLKSAVTKASKYEPILNKSFKDFGLHYGCAINPTRSYHPQDKALVEGAVKLVYQRIFYPMSKMQFFSLADLNQEIDRLLKIYNDYLLTYLGISRRQQFLDIEQVFLNELPTENYELKYYKKAKVQKMGHIFLSADKHYYSVPYRYIGKQIEVSYNQNTVEIYYGQQRVATHKRSFRSGRYSTIKEHLCSSHKFYQNWSPAFFGKLARPHGQQVVQYIKMLIESKPYPEVAYKQCLGIIALAKTYCSDRLNKACKRGLHYHRYGYQIIKEILDHNMDKVDDLENQTEHIPIEKHENIRGQSYYHSITNPQN